MEAAIAKVLKIVAVVAAVVAVAASVAMTFGATAVLGVSLATVAAAASTISTLAALGARAMQKPPDMKGTINEVMIGANMPVPYVMGRTFVGGMKIYDDSADGSDNDERTQIFVGTHAGPIQSFEKFLADYSQITLPTSGGRIEGEASGFYDNFFWVNSRLGNRPDTALTPVTGMTGTIRGWGASHKLSGMACWSATMEFDEEGKRWASGIPAFGMVAKWVKVYDPRKDSTYPGGSGTHDWDDEGTWEFGSPGVGTVAVGENPALHALAYARGRFMGTNNVKVVGAGIPREAIDIAAFVELANVCDANDWTCGGAVYEGPGLSRWDNLKRILAAAAAEPAWVGGKLTVRMSAPRVALDTITADDLADGDVEIKAMTSWKERFNTIVPRYRSESHRWEYVQAGAVSNPTYVTEDGETKTDEVQFDLCQDVTQAAQLAAYQLVNRREFGPITLNCKPRLMGFKPGEALEIDLPEAGLSNQLAVIISRTVDPAMGTVQLVLESETSDKHSWALTRTGEAPPTPSLVPPEDVDETVADQTTTTTDVTLLIAQSYVTGLTFTVETDGDITISDHTRVYPDKSVSVTGATVTAPAGTANPDVIAIYYDDQARAGGAVSYQMLVLEGGTGDLSPASPSPTNPYRHQVAVRTVPSTGTGSGGSNIGSGGGGGGGYGGWNTVLQ